ncbi:GNAT family N-acetyltransferase [Rhodospirillum sp. A1_3_36]|uniref:GNAT family N-acetyltransferase n=1 Tax=Rhodospirillum sp. A1_3_36 TaxID=3391666 RepID=UPI0039A5DE42
MTIRVKNLTGEAARAVADDLARLRISVFREFPYLYDGTTEYERKYLETYAKARDGVVVTAFDGDRVIGAATALPLTAEPDHMAAPFREAGIAPETVFYFGESVLEPAYRGRGLGHAFFDGRENHARDLGYTTSAFCAIIRPEDHPRRPADYRPLDAFWTKRGYVRQESMTCQMTWQDLDEDSQSPKTLRFWTREL